MVRPSMISTRSAQGQVPMICSLFTGTAAVGSVGTAVGIGLIGAPAGGATDGARAPGGGGDGAGNGLGVGGFSTPNDLGLASGSGGFEGMPGIGAGATGAGGAAATMGTGGERGTTGPGAGA